MKAFVYISGSFVNVSRSPCGGPHDHLDNDPHFWRPPPSWGICRPDLREKVDVGDYVFYVLPRSAELPQMVYGYLRVADIITHEEAFRNPNLKDKRMRKGKNPNGNIIVNAKGNYHPADGEVHRDRFERIRERYVVGDPEESEFLLTDTRRLIRLARDFVATLNRILGRTDGTPFQAITRYGRALTERQAGQLLSWLQE